MKEKSILWALPIYLLLLNSCSKDDSTVNSGELVSSVFRATYSSDTRTVMNDKHIVRWMIGDKISMNGYESGDNDVAVDHTECANFNVTYNVPADGKYYAFYPASMVTGAGNPKSGYANGKFIINFPNEQPYGDNDSFSSGFNPSVAYNTTYDLGFENLCGILKVQLKLGAIAPISGIYKVRFEANENVAGNKTEVDPVAKTITPKSTATPSKTMDVTFARPYTLAANVPITIHFVLPPQTYSGHWYIKLLDSNDNSKATIKFTDPITINRSKIRSVGTIVVLPNGVIDYFDDPDSGEESYRTAPRICYDKETKTMQLTTDPTNPGLYFKFGSVIGINAGTDLATSPLSNGTVFSSSDVIFNPTVVPNRLLNDWNNIFCYTDADFNNNLRNISDATYHNVANLQLGKGDPCKLLGYTADQVRSLLASGKVPDSGWRLPNNEENDSYAHGNDGSTGEYDDTSDWYNGGSPRSVPAGRFFPHGSGTNTSLRLVRTYLPATGIRNYSEGTVYYQGSYGYYWSSMPNNSYYGHTLIFSESYAYPQRGGHPAYGFSVRCVQ